MAEDLSSLGCAHCRSLSHWYIWSQDRETGPADVKKYLFLNIDPCARHRRKLFGRRDRSFAYHLPPWFGAFSRRRKKLSGGQWRISSSPIPNTARRANKSPPAARENVPLRFWHTYLSDSEVLQSVLNRDEDQKLSIQYLGAQSFPEHVGSSNSSISGWIMRLYDFWSIETLNIYSTIVCAFIHMGPWYPVVLYLVLTQPSRHLRKQRSRLSGWTSLEEQRAGRSPLPLTKISVCTKWFSHRTLRLPSSWLPDSSEHHSKSETPNHKEVSD